MFASNPFRHDFLFLKCIFLALRASRGGQRPGGNWYNPRRRIENKSVFSRSDFSDEAGPPCQRRFFPHLKNNFQKNHFFSSAFFFCTKSVSGRAPLIQVWECVSFVAQSKIHSRKRCCFSMGDGLECSFFHFSATLGLPFGFEKFCNLFYFASPGEGGGRNSGYELGEGIWAMFFFPSEQGNPWVGDAPIWNSKGKGGCRAPTAQVFPNWNSEFPTLPARPRRWICPSRLPNYFFSFLDPGKCRRTIGCPIHF